jgi:hypothetical protein
MALGSTELALHEITVALRDDLMRAHYRVLESGVMRRGIIPPEPWQTISLIAELDVSQNDRGFPVYGGYTGRVYVKEWGPNAHLFLPKAKADEVWPSPAKPLPASIAPPAQGTERRGRKPEYDWPVIEVEAIRMLIDEGAPSNYTDFAKQLISWCEKRYDAAPSVDLMRAKVPGWVARYERWLPKLPKK